MQKLVIRASAFRWALVAALLVGATGSVAAQNAFDVNTLPRPAGAEIAPDRSSSSSVTYIYPAPVTATTVETEKALVYDPAADVWSTAASLPDSAGVASAMGH